MNYNEKADNIKAMGDVQIREGTVQHLLTETKINRWMSYRDSN